MSKHTPEFIQPQLPFAKLCECGCGQPAPLATITNPKRGYVKGQPVRYISGHNIKRIAPMPNPNPSGMCMCGCGQPTPIATRNHAQSGSVKGQPIRFIHGHNTSTYSAPPEQRFWASLDKNGPNGCRLWIGSFDTKGYGRIWVDDGHIAAHRFAYELHYGPIPQGMEVCHSCDNPPCCNAEHLWLGTHADNIRDAVKKGRKIMPTSDNRGERHGMAHFRDDEVVVMREEFAKRNLSIREFAQEQGVPYRTMLAVIHRKSWKHI